MASISSISAGGGAALAEPRQQDAAVEDRPSQPGHETSQGATANGGRAWDGFTLHDLHPGVQQFAFGPQHEADSHALLAQFNPPTKRNSASDAGVPLFGAHQARAGAPAQGNTTAQVSPKPPQDLARMVALNQQVQQFKNARDPIPQSQRREVQEAFQKATDALHKGDYAKAEQLFKELGIPAPANKSDPANVKRAITAHLLGVPAHGQRDGGWTVDGFKLGKGGQPNMNDLHGFAANAHMMNRMSSVLGSNKPLSNPPTEAQCMEFIRKVAQGSNGKPASPQEVMQAARDVTNGSIVHYSSAGARDPVYGQNPNPHAFYSDRKGARHEFDSAAEANAARRAGQPPAAPRSPTLTMRTNSPDEWSDISSKGTHAGRQIGDCESKLYLQTRLLTEAGFKSLGSVDVQGGNIGHQFGVFQGKDGSVWVTSNEDSRRLTGSGPKGQVTQQDVDAALRQWTGEIYHRPQNALGEYDTKGFKLTAAATEKLSGANAATDSIRRAVELGLLHRSDTLIPPPKTQP